MSTAQQARAAIEAKIDRTTKYAGQHTPVVPVLQDFLQSRRKSVDLPYTRESMEMGMPEFDSKSEKGVVTYTWNTFTLSQVLECLEAFMTYMPTTGPKTVTNSIPSYASTRKHFSDIMALTYTPEKGNYANVEVNGFFSVVGNFRFGYKKTVAKQKLQAKVSAGEGFFATDVLDNDGVPRAYPSSKKAAKAWARRDPVLKVHDKANKSKGIKAGDVVVPHVRVGGGFGVTWHEGAYGMSKKEILDEASTHVYKQADAVGKANHAPTNSYTMRMVEGLHWTAIVRLARVNGSTATKKADALMYIQDNFSKLDFACL
jgi:hypothetical protein